MKILFHTVSWKKSQTNTWNVYNNPGIVTVSSPYQHISTAYPDPSTVAPSVSLSEPSGIGEEAKELLKQGFCFFAAELWFFWKICKLETFLTEANFRWTWEMEYNGWWSWWLMNIEVWNVSVFFGGAKKCGWLSSNDDLSNSQTTQVRFVSSHTLDDAIVSQQAKHQLSQTVILVSHCGQGCWNLVLGLCRGNQNSCFN